MDSSATKITKELYSSANEKVLELKGFSREAHSALIRLPFTTKKEFCDWFEAHQRLTGITFRLKNTRPSKGITVLYKAEFRCEHNTYPESHRSRNCKASKKHTDCKSFVKVTIKSNRDGYRVRSKDQLRLDFPTIIRVHHDHNHPLDDPEAVEKKRRLAAERKSKKRSAEVIFFTEEDLDLADFETEDIVEEAEIQSFSFGNDEDDSICASLDERVPLWDDAEKIISEVTDRISHFVKSRFSSNPKEAMDALETFKERAFNLSSEGDFVEALRRFGVTSAPPDDFSREKCVIIGQRSPSSQLNQQTVTSRTHHFPTRRKCVILS